MAEVAQEQADQMKTQRGWDRYVAAQLCGTKGTACQAKLVSALETELAQPSTSLPSPFPPSPQPPPARPSKYIFPDLSDLLALHYILQHGIIRWIPLRGNLDLLGSLHCTNILQ